jgi:hypothetical protein
MALERIDRTIGRLSRRKALGGLSAATAAALASRLAEVNAGPLPGGPTLVGVGKYGRNVIEYIGMINQAAFDFEVVGYLTYIAGLDPKLLFKNGDPKNHKVQDARFPFLANLEGSARSMYEVIFTVHAEGEARFFYNRPGGSTFDDPGTFNRGKEIASGLMRVQNTINATSMEDGIATGGGDLTIKKVASFTIGQKSYQLGARGLHERMSWAGSGELTDPEPPNSVIIFAGNAFIVRD